MFTHFTKCQGRKRLIVAYHESNCNLFPELLLLIINFFPQRAYSEQ